MDKREYSQAASTDAAIIVSAVLGLEDTLDAVRHHHEGWDGDGYRFRLSGEETRLIARLMAAADALSATATDRPYRKGMEETKAFSILEHGMRTRWNAVCVQAFLRAEKMNVSVAPTSAQNFPQRV